MHQTSNLNDSTLHEITDLDRHITEFYNKKAENNKEIRPKSI